MSSDKTIIIDVLRRAGIEYEDGKYPKYVSSIEIYGGYPGFVTVISFDRDEKLVAIEAFE